MLFYDSLFLWSLFWQTLAYNFHLGCLLFFVFFISCPLYHLLVVFFNYSFLVICPSKFRSRLLIVSSFFIFSIPNISTFLIYSVPGFFLGRTILFSRDQKLLSSELHSLFLLIYKCPARTLQSKYTESYHPHFHNFPMMEKMFSSGRFSLGNLERATERMLSQTPQSSLRLTTIYSIYPRVYTSRSLSVR